VKELRPQVFATTNPGGIGHLWVKKRFVDPSPPGKPFKDPTSGRSRIFIPATVDDNPILMQVDPDYVRMLDAIKDTDEDLYKAWRLGDWDTFAGQYFKNFNRAYHVIEKHRPLLNGSASFILGSLDWGRVDNFAFYLHHVFQVHYNGQSFWRVITFSEVYGKDKYPKEWAEIIMKRLEGLDLTLESVPNIMADNQIFGQSATDVGKTIADMFYEHSEQFRGRLKPASKNRIAGWEGMQNWLSFAPDGKPYWQMTENCVNLIRTLPAAVHDENVREDILQGGEDDALDSCRYGFTALKWIDGKAEGVVKGSDTIVEHSTLHEDKDLFDDDEADFYKHVI
jgi:hypothetical protein